MDYKKMLIVYMDAVISAEGVHFIEYIDKKDLTKEELETLYHIGELYKSELSTEEKIKIL